MNKNFTVIHQMPSLQLNTAIVLLFLSSALCAEVKVNNLESNDKVTAGPVQAKNNGVPGKNITGSVDKKMETNSGSWELQAEQWELERRGETILSLPVLNAVVNKWLTEQHKMIEIQYPGGEDGEFWVQELTDWFVSLGIPSNMMITTPGSGADDMIRFNLIR